MQNRNKGITLVALIITIVVMLILVAVSVNVVIKSNLIGTAEKTVNKYKTASEEEGKLKGIKVNGKNLDSYIPLPDIKAGERATENSNYKGVTIPKGFTVSGINSEQSINNGLVIYDIPEGTTLDWTNPDSVKTKYNQFVWIPVEVKSTDTENSIASFYRSEWTANASTGGDRTTGLSTDYTEPYSYDTTNNYDQINGIADQITELTKSIYKYGGFYIGRYEAGSEKSRIYPSLQTAEFVVQQDKYPYAFVKWGKNMSDVSEGAVYLCNNLYNKTNNQYGAISMLCTGAAWDSMLDFIKDSSHSVTNSTTWGNYRDSETYKIYRGSLGVYSNSAMIWNQANTTTGTDVTKDTSVLLTTGATERNSSKNIYDVAGNLNEWTTESRHSNNRANRGRRLQRLWFSQSSEVSHQRPLDQLPSRPRFSSSTLCKDIDFYAIQIGFSDT